MSEENPQDDSNSFTASELKFIENRYKDTSLCIWVEQQEKNSEGSNSTNYLLRSRTQE
ncbi:unnamed protein product [Clavelina lepadiformis]|uniref:Uncharacterized protein n=1 Tax=Clavelina lepadiformis TaxID=159417 RepID=A0ABP0F3M2_CLALP